MARSGAHSRCGSPAPARRRALGGRRTGRQASSQPPRSSLEPTWSPRRLPAPGNSRTEWTTSALGPWGRHRLVGGGGRSILRGFGGATASARCNARSKDPSEQPRFAAMLSMLRPSHRSATIALFSARVRCGAMRGLRGGGRGGLEGQGRARGGQERLAGWGSNLPRARQAPWVLQAVCGASEGCLKG
jgi:hypothetical protein